jgi:hypothetical protein
MLRAQIWPKALTTRSRLKVKLQNPYERVAYSTNVTIPVPRS